MNLDDESQLSAFLDDELDPGDRLMVAWNIESAPTLARQLADLQTTQSLIRGLDRPTIPLDLAATIMAEVARSRVLGRRRRAATGAGRFAAAFIGVGTMAASLVFALIFLHRSLHDDKNPPLFGFADPRDQPPRELDLVLNPPPAGATPAFRSQRVADAMRESESESESLSKAKAKEPVELAADLKPAPPAVHLVAAPGGDGAGPARPDQIDAMLGHGKVIRALIVTDVLDQTSSQVRSLIEQDATREAEFGQITLAQGIVIDPDRPGEAEIYSVVLNESSSQPFLDRLSRAFPEMKLEKRPAPTLVTQLSKVGRVAIFSGVRPAARLGSPPDAVASVVAAKGASMPDQFLPATIVPLNPGGFRADALADAGRGRSSLGEPSPPPPDTSKARARRAEAPGPAPPPSVDAPGPVTVLVWVTSRTPRP